jgi:predicted O-methyltransferase YrrM
MTTAWTQEKLLELVRGFQPACVVAAAADLDLFSHLNSQPTEAACLAQTLEADTRGLRILLDALVALDLIIKQDGAYGVTESVKQLMSPEADGSILAGIQHLANCLRSWSQLAHTIKTGHPSERGPSVRGLQGDTESFIAAMQTFTRDQIPETLRQLHGLQFAHMLDIGGASGNWTAGFLDARPDARATLFDLPQVIPLAQSHLAQCHMADRVQCIPGDYNTDALPGGADFAWLSAITHQNARAQNKTLFARIFTALQPGGTLIIRDIVMAPDRTHPVPDALFAVNMLACTQAGNTFTWDEYHEDLRDARLTNIELIREGEGMNSLIQATRPS